MEEASNNSSMNIQQNLIKQLSLKKSKKNKKIMNEELESKEIEWSSSGSVFNKSNKKAVFELMSESRTEKEVNESQFSLKSSNYINKAKNSSVFNKVDDNDSIQAAGILENMQSLNEITDQREIKLMENDNNRSNNNSQDRLNNLNDLLLAPDRFENVVNDSERVVTKNSEQPSSYLIKQFNNNQQKVTDQLVKFDPQNNLPMQLTKPELMNSELHHIKSADENEMKRGIQKANNWDGVFMTTTNIVLTHPNAGFKRKEQPYGYNSKPKNQKTLYTYNSILKSTHSQNIKSRESLSKENLNSSSGNDTNFQFNSETIEKIKRQIFQSESEQQLYTQLSFEPEVLTEQAKCVTVDPDFFIKNREKFPDKAKLLNYLTNTSLYTCMNVRDLNSVLNLTTPIKPPSNYGDSILETFNKYQFPRRKEKDISDLKKEVFNMHLDNLEIKRRILRELTKKEILKRNNFRVNSIHKSNNSLNTIEEVCESLLFKNQSTGSDQVLKRFVETTNDYQGKQMIFPKLQSTKGAQSLSRMKTEMSNCLTIKPCKTETEFTEGTRFKPQKSKVNLHFQPIKYKSNVKTNRIIFTKNSSHSKIKSNITQTEKFDIESNDSSSYPRQHNVISEVTSKTYNDFQFDIDKFFNKELLEGKRHKRSCDLNDFDDLKVANNKLYKTLKQALPSLFTKSSNTNN